MVALPKRITGHPCVKCGGTPRLVTSTGVELTMCEPCQRAYWSERKRIAWERKPKAPKPERPAKAPKPPRPPKAKPERAPKTVEVNASEKPNCLIVDRVSNRLMLVTVFSESDLRPSSEQSIQFYERLGYRIVEVKRETT